MAGLPTSQVHIKECRTLRERGGLGRKARCGMPNGGPLENNECSRWVQSDVVAVVADVVDNFYLLLKNKKASYTLQSKNLAIQEIIILSTSDHLRALWHCILVKWPLKTQLGENNLVFQQPGWAYTYTPGWCLYMWMGIAVWTYKSVSTPPRQLRTRHCFPQPAFTISFRDFLYWWLGLNYDAMIFQMQRSWIIFGISHSLESVPVWWINLGPFSVRGLIIGKGMRKATCIWVNCNAGSRT